MIKYLIVFVFFLVIAGCSSSEVTSTNQTSNASKELNTVEELKKEIGTLKEKIAKLEQEKRTAIAKVAELEIKLSELEEKPTQKEEPEKVTLPLNNTSEKYESALSTFRERKYNEALKIFRSILDDKDYDELRDNCYYWIGECLYALREYKEAIENFNKVFDYPQSEKKDDAQLMIANSYLAIGNKVKAKAEYQKLIDDFPSSPYIKYAKVKLKNL